jgi:uncharacterized protein YeaC (DUF1315 family)
VRRADGNRQPNAAHDDRSEGNRVVTDLLQNKPATFEALLAGMTPEIHQSLKLAVELGKWPNGERLAPEQVELCLQAVIAWDLKHLPESERVAYIDRGDLQKKRSDRR